MNHLKRNQSRSLAILNRGGIRNESVGVWLARVVQEQEENISCCLMSFAQSRRDFLVAMGTVVVIHDHVMIKLSSFKGLACTQLDNPATYLGSP